MLLVKPPVSLLTPQIFKTLDLDGRSTADPRKLLDGLREKGTITQELCVNDLESPAFSILPQLAELKERLKREGNFESVFMTGSGSTIVCFGSDDIPNFLSNEEKYSGLFISPARLINRMPGKWYTPSNAWTTNVVV